MTAIIIRPAEDKDLPGILDLIRDRIGEEDAPEAELVLTDPAYDRTRWSVAVDGERVVSTMASFPMTATIGSCSLPGSMLEFVATQQDYEGRGLIRRQFDYHRDDLAARGDLFHLIIGITYFYRRLGYEYAIPVGTWHSVAATSVPPMPDGWTVREASADDHETVAATQEKAFGKANVAIGFDRRLAGWVLRSPVYTTLIAESGDGMASARIYMDDGEPYVLDLAATSRDGVTAVLAAVGERAPGQNVTIHGRPVALPLLDGLADMSPAGDAYYARIEDPVTWLNAIRPELSRRLAASDLAAASGDGLISMYVSSVNFSYANGQVGEFVAGPRDQAPISKGGSGIAPDLIASLLLGPLGFSGLAERHPDVNAGKQKKLMDILFPPQTTDVQSWVVP